MLFGCLTLLFITVSFGFELVHAACCYCPYPYTAGGICYDGTKCTPNCGYGPCNIFACNCDGGCRKGPISRSPIEIPVLPDDESSNLFAITDTDGDGKITFVEWRDSAVRSTFSNENNSTLSRYWARYDTVNVGYLTEDQAIKRRA
ncbi:hypothetical protein PILCRDRAFT_13104 [Piloderma croceum F 1598]|uniref:EF-hand domain-containing protein n=1 Tax=Piloderma croceum (strain F 1598) TaxID=765440 RepID=A0A0C3BFJ8_PILCF|nr:hypothetical protein PILCRDRAFT_13104 [Piloderma croceum F 1598]